MRDKIKQFIVDNTYVSGEEIDKLIDNYLGIEENEEELSTIESVVNDYLNVESDKYEDDIYFWAPGGEQHDNHTGE